MTFPLNAYLVALLSGFFATSLTLHSGEDGACGSSGG